MHTDREIALAFAERAIEAMRACGSPLCVGIDPRAADLPPALAAAPGAPPAEQRAADLAGARALALGLVELAAEERVALVKPQAAFFEALGPAGVTLFADVLAAAREAGVLTIADAKRGDIGSTAAAYASAFFGEAAPFQADALTIYPYTGPEGLTPFVEAARRTAAGLFVLVRTSNPGAAAWQEAPDEGGVALCDRIARWITEANATAAGTDTGAGAEAHYGPVGAVIGATVARATVVRLRAALPRSLLLVPGVGAQGARPDDLDPFFDERGEGAIVPVSRGIASSWPADRAWQDVARERMRALHGALADAARRARRA